MRKREPQKIWYTVGFRLRQDTEVTRCVCLRAFDAETARRDAASFLRDKYATFASTARVSKGSHWRIYPDRVFIDQVPKNDLPASNDQGA